MSVLFKEPYLAIDFLSESRTLCLIWTGHATTEEHHFGWNRALEIAKEKKVRCWILDQHKREPPLPDDSAWLLVNWAPRAVITLGSFGAVAFIDSSNPFTDVNTTVLMRQMQENMKGMQFGRFDNLPEAREWLRTMVV